MNNGVEVNGVMIYPGDVFGRQGDIYVRYIDPAKEPGENVRILGQIPIAKGEFLGHVHNVYALDEHGELAVENPNLMWLVQATQAAPNYLESFSSGLVPVGTELRVQTPAHGAVLIHEAYGREVLDNDYHAPIPLWGNAVFAFFRQQERTIDQRTRNAGD